jgi:hypothetical protein
LGFADGHRCLLQRFARVIKSESSNARTITSSQTVSRKE